MRFFGHFDGIRDGEIYGWALDKDDPLQPVKITAYVNNRRAGDALAAYYRPDVAERMTCSGRHGFYMDLSRCFGRAGEVIIDVRFPNGELLDGTPIRAHVPARDRSPHSTLLFMHIPKTAGTALREAALSNYRQSEVAYLYTDAPGLAPHLEGLPLEQRAGFRFVVGHFAYGLHEWVPNDSWYFTILRNPFSRIWSTYNHLIEQNSSLAFTADGRIRSLEEMFENRIAAELDNLTVRYLSGVDERVFPVGAVNREAYELAVLHVEQAFPYIGMQERLDEAYEYLRKKLAWTGDLPPKVMNAASYSSTGRYGSQEEKLMRHFNNWDILLYDHVRQRTS